jgi:hypothetical protein
MKKIIIALGMAVMLILPVFSATVTIPGYDPIEVPDDVASLVNSHMTEIKTALDKNNVTNEDLKKYSTEVTKAYNTIDIPNPYNTAVNGLNGFSDDLKDTLPNTQIQQNVWANSWIGYLVQVGNGKFCPRFGLGANVGAASIKLESFKEMGNAFKLDFGSLPDLLAIPTITFDARLGGVKVNDLALPFDFGFTLCGVDSSKLGLDSLMKDVRFDFFSIGFDARYCVWEPHVLDTKVSVGAGFYYTKGSVSVNNTNANAGLDFSSTNFTLNGQISAKLLFFRPFFGARFMFTNSKVDWYVKNINWRSILNDSSELMASAISSGLLPTNIDGGADGFKFRPVIQGGFAFDLAVIDLTFSGSYDLSSNIFGGAFSLRFSL